MEGVLPALHYAFGTNLEGKEMAPWQMALRAALVFFVAMALIRIASKRFMGKSTAVDVMIGIVFGSLASRTITGESPLLATLAAGATLVVLHWAVAALSCRYPKLREIFMGKPDTLVEAGVLRHGNMRRASVSEHDLHEALRQEGEQPELERIEAAYLERDGKIYLRLK